MQKQICKRGISIETVLHVEGRAKSKKIPFNRRSVADMITRAARYERLIELGAPEIVVTEEGRCLAEEMVLYYYGKEEPIIWD